MEFIKISLIILQAVSILLNMVGLPGGVISAVFPVILFLMGYLALKPLIWVLLLIMLGEAIEFYAAYAIGKRYGVDNTTFWVSVAGAFVLALVMSPMFFGLGAIIGTFIGAYLAALIFETVRGASLARARDKAKGILFGRFMGTFAKIAAGMTGVYIVVKQLY